MADTTSAAPSLLLPCPFCGGAPSIKRGKIFNSIVCPPGPCKGTGLVFAFDFGEEETSRAIAAWNRRVPQPVAREPLTDEKAKAVLWAEHLRWMEAAGLDTEGMQPTGEWLYHWLTYVRAIERAHGIAGDKA